MRSYSNQVPDSQKFEDLEKDLDLKITKSTNALVDFVDSKIAFTLKTITIPFSVALVLQLGIDIVLLIKLFS